MTEITGTPGESTRRPVPAWVGMALVAVCVLAGAAFIWWVVRDPLTGGSDFIPDANGPVAAARGPRANFRPPPSPDSVRKVADTPNGESYLAQVGGAMMDVVAGKDGKNRYNLRYAPKNLLTPEQRDLMVMRFRVMNDEATATHIGLTDDQKQQLQKITTNYPMDIAAADKDGLIALFDTYHKATDDKAKAAAEKNLLAALKTAGDKNLNASKKKATDRITQITTILSADQVQKFKAMSAAP
jgi:Spy/CpxP family protein refolding chaperone